MRRSRRGLTFDAEFDAELSQIQISSELQHLPVKPPSICHDDAVSS